MILRPMLKLEDNGYAEDVRRAFDELESSLTRRLSAGGAADIAEFEEKIAWLTSQKKLLEEKLSQREAECAQWRDVCGEIVESLNSSIETVRSILNGENI
ncbi:MAG: DUF4164 domain-containing protein [Anaplasma sp.]